MAREQTKMEVVNQFKERQRVIFIPKEANGDPDHPTCKKGVVMGQKGQAVEVIVNGDLHLSRFDARYVKIRIE